MGEVVNRFELTQSAISRHLDVLERAHLIVRRRDGQRRICSLNTLPLQELDSWLDGYRRFWSVSLSRMDDLVARSKS